MLYADPIVAADALDGDPAVADDVADRLDGDDMPEASIPASSSARTPPNRTRRLRPSRSRPHLDRCARRLPSRHVRPLAWTCGTLPMHRCAVRRQRWAASGVRADYGTDTAGG